MLELFKTVNLDPFDFGNPEQAKQAFGMLQNRIKRGFNETDNRLKTTGDITVNVQGQQGGLDDLLEAGLLRVGDVVWMYVGWGEAMRRRQYGWEPCDGDNGTPPMIPRAGSSDPQRFMRAVEEGEDPWSGIGRTPNTGGGGTHTHPLGLSDHTLVLEDHSAHAALSAHSVVTCTFCACAGGTTVLTNVTVGNHDAISAHSAHVQDNGTSFDHNANSCDGTAPSPPFAEGIPMMRVR